MFNELSKLEDIALQMECIISLFNCMRRSYFEKSEPNSYDLKIFYNDYVNTIEAIRQMTIAQKDALSESTDKLYNIWREFKR